MKSSEKTVVPIEWNATEIAYPADKCLHHFLSERAETMPDAIAVICDGESLTYGQLERQSNQVARYLQQKGAGLEVPVAIFIERSLAMVVGLYGILKTGSCYVPLDPTYPQSRLTLMLEDVGAPLLLTQASLAGSLATENITKILIDTEWEQIEQESAETFPSPATPDNLAYIIYTSGSTGRPKGAMLNHQGRVNNFADFNRRYAIGTEDAVLGIASLSFDMSAYDTFGTAMAGGTLVIVPQAAVLDPLRWAQLMITHNVTVWHSVPALLGMLADTIEEYPNYIPHCLRVYLLGGDWIPVTLPDRMRAMIPDVQGVSMGGATECSMDSTIYDMNDPSTGWQSIPYGVPMANQTCYVLDPDLQPVAVGEEGELYLGGIGVGRGYFERPDLTAAKFVPNPFSSVPGDRLYRTGDLVRYFPDGNLQLLGRIDFMVKIRGFRIEIGEIESAIRQHAGVKECLVLARDDMGAEKRLVAYLLQDAHYVGDEETQQKLQTDQVNEWLTVYETAYQQTGDLEDPTFNIVSWDSSFTDRPIPADQMREWVENTVERILHQQPQRVLEIGCGTGLLLFRIAPHTQRYVGTDFSPTAINYVQQYLEQQELSEIVELGIGSAENYAAYTPNSFDSVVLNSIVVDFPSLDYLLEVLEGAADVVAPGGTIFVGDVRHLPLLEAFHTAVQLYRAPDHLTVAQLQKHISRRVSAEEELVIDPAFFAALPALIPAISHVSIQPKVGRGDNEMMRFRYDVTMHIGDDSVSDPVENVIEWQADWTLADLTAHIENHTPTAFVVRSIPDARTALAVTAVDYLADHAEANVAQVREGLAQLAAERTTIHPDDVLEWAQGMGYCAELQMSAVSGCIDALIYKQELRQAPKPATFLTPDPDTPFYHYANNPLRVKMRRQLIPALRTHLESRLPDYMIPTAFVVLEAFPLNPNGKINRRAFPKPDNARPALAQPYVAPRNPVESVLEEMWRNLFEIDQIGVFDPFIVLGGHSLLATQLVSRIRDMFGINLPLSYGFNATIAELAEQINAHGEEAGIHVAQIARRAAGMNRAGTIARRRANATTPASFLQENMWFNEQLNPDTDTYTVPMITRLVGSLDVAALERALNVVEQRHEALRTVFASHDGQLLQVVTDFAPTPLRVIEWPELTEAEREEQAVQLAAEEAHRALSLTDGPLHYRYLIRISPTNHIFVVVVHHIVTDGWSMGVFTRELTALYAAFATEQPDPLAELPIQFADYALWQRERLHGDQLALLRRYWQQQLRGHSFKLNLPTDFPRPALQAGRGNHVSIDISPELTHQVRELNRANNVSAFVTLVAAFKILLAATCQQDDVIVGTPIANRNYSELEALIGYFVNLIPLRSVVGATDFLTYLNHVNEVVIAANMHQELPFGSIVEAVQPPRDTSRNPIFQAEFTLLSPEHTPAVYGYGFRSPVAETVMLGEVTMEPVAIESGVSKFDITMLLWDAPDQISGTFEYDTDLFKEATIAGMVTDYMTILQTIVANPNTPIAALKQPIVARQQQVAQSAQATRKKSAAKSLKSLRRKRTKR